MAAQANIYEAKAKFSELVERAEHGEEIIIARAGKPVAKLVPVEEIHGKRRIGGQNIMGITYIAPNAFDPMTEEELADWGL